MLRVRTEYRRVRQLTLLAMACNRREETAQKIREVDAVELDFLHEFVGRNLVGPIVAHAVLEALEGTPPGTADWRVTHEESALRMEVLLHQLDCIAYALDRENIPVVALKNAGIARGIFPCAACCPMGDIDVLIKKEQFRKAHEVVLSMGFEHTTRAPEVEPADFELGIDRGGTEYLKQVGKEQVWLELQWRPVAGRWIRSDQEPGGSYLIDRSVPIEDSFVRVLAPEDNMLQVCLHTAKHSYLRAPGLRLHLDVDRLAYFAPPAWDEIVRTARTLRVTTPVYFSLSLAKALLGTTIPQEVLDAMQPPAWKIAAVSRWLERADFFEPSEPKFSRLGLLCFHALLYDSFAGILASICDTEETQLRPGNLPRHIPRGARRVVDLLSRYQS